LVDKRNAYIISASCSKLLKEVKKVAAIQIMAPRILALAKTFLLKVKTNYCMLDN
jgi:hypothetical protein